MVTRPRHQNKELEAILRSLEAQGWRVTRGKGYYRARCTCGQFHQEWA